MSQENKADLFFKLHQAILNNERKETEIKKSVSYLNSQKEQVEDEIINEFIEKQKLLGIKNMLIKIPMSDDFILSVDEVQVTIIKVVKL
jgi:hypothetical protein